MSSKATNFTISRTTSFPDLPPIDEAHVVVLVNYLRRHHALVFQQIAKEVGKLTILLSTAMEPDRAWSPDWGDLDVQIQKNWMYTTRWKHSSGFQEPNFIHIPVDTFGRLRGLNPDIVFSYEMGMRSAFCGLFRMLRRKVPLVMVGNMADHIERERGFARRMIRGFVRRRVDYATYNGPSCKRYLQELGFADDNLFHFPYCIDFDKAYAGEQTFSADGFRHLIYTGAISSRKGIVPFAESLRDYLKQNDAPKVKLSIAGDGPLAGEVTACQNENLEINLLGNCDSEQLSAAYQAADICAFPTYGDEWGLVPIEAMASGLPVLGSVLAQSVEATVTEGENGWRFDPTNEASMSEAIGRALSTSQSRMYAMSENARASIRDCTPDVSATKFCNIIRTLTGAEAKPETATAGRENIVVS